MLLLVHLNFEYYYSCLRLRLIIIKGYEVSVIIMQLLHIGYREVTTSELLDLLQIRVNSMKVVRQYLNYYYLFTKVIMDFKLFKQFSFIRVALILFTVVVLNWKNYFDFYVIEVKNDCSAHYDLDCYHYGNC